MIAHMRESFENYDAKSKDGKFIWIAFTLKRQRFVSPSTSKSKDTPDKDDLAVIRLCFQAKDLYLRGWTADESWSFMAAWDKKERKEWRSALLDELPDNGLANYRGGREKGPHVRSDYDDKDNSPELRLKRKDLFTNLGVLYLYLAQGAHDATVLRQRNEDACSALITSPG
ncbi:hypothetical protein [Nocardia asiatica]|uniref:hypothetical protein n=1 Tax=Nocardia asiatica TaxID=209252 RepID=UPI0024577192|nr:hypothetical protein [Nocardia asiatica]